MKQLIKFNSINFNHNIFPDIHKSKKKEIETKKNAHSRKILLVEKMSIYKCKNRPFMVIYE